MSKVSSVPIHSDSSMMKELNAEALIKARKLLGQKFNDPDDLDDISMISQQLQKQMLVAESKLNTAVQGKLDALKRAVDLMDESAVKLTTFTSNMRKVDERIVQSNTDITNYDHLKRVHNAKENVNKVIEQVEFFAKVPERVKYLSEVLNTEEHRLKEVFLESLKLESLRLALLKEMKIGRNRRASMDNNDPTGSPKLLQRTPPLITRESMTGQDVSERVKSVVEDHLKSIPDLMSKIQKRLNGNIERMMDLGPEQPADLVATFEIIEMHQQYLNRRLAQEQKKRNNNNHAKNFSQNVIDEARQRIHRLLDEKVEGIFEVTCEEGSFNGLTKSGATLEAATQIVSMITFFKHEVLPCIPPHYDTMNDYITIFEENLLPRIESFSNDMNSLEVADIIQLIDWLEYYIYQVTTFNVGVRPCCETFVAIGSDLMDEYLTRIKSQVMQWFDNIRKQPAEITQATNKTLITSVPEEMFGVIHMQLSVAKEKLPREHLKDVANACLQVLREVQRQNYDTLEQDWQTMEQERICSFINDTQRMQEKCQELSDNIIKLVPQEDEKEMLFAMLEEVSNEYISIAVFAVNKLARSVLIGLEEEVFDKLFSYSYEAGEKLGLIIIATFNDFFQDLENWLTDFFYCKLVREILSKISGLYLMSLRRHSSSIRFHSELVVANRIIVDMGLIYNFFVEYADVLRKAGLRCRDKNISDTTVAIKEELEYMVNVARVISATHVSGAVDDLKSLYEKWGNDSLKLVQQIIHSNPTMSNSEKVENITFSIKLFDKGGNAYLQNIPNENFKLAPHDASDELISLTKDLVSSMKKVADKSKVSSSFTFFGRKGQ